MRTIFLLLAAFVLLFTGCDDDDSNNSNNNHNSTNNNHNNNDNNTQHEDDVVSQVQNSSSSGYIADGGSVNLKNVVVTAVDKYGDRTGAFYVSEPQGGAWNGVMVFAKDPSAPWFVDLNVGDIIHVQGTKEEYSYEDPPGTPLFDDPVTEIVDPVVTVVGPGTPVTPTVVQAADLTDVTTAEQWEGTLVTLKNVRIQNLGDNANRFEAYIYQGPKIQDDMVEISTIQEGDCLASVTGVVAYFFDYYIVPRSAADVEVAADDSACPTIAVEICDNGVDDDGNTFTDCDDFACIGDPACPPKVENDDTLCLDTIDNDEDGLVDCADPSCSGHPDVTVCVENDCSDGQDNDGDGHTDCQDYDCSWDPVCAAEYEQECTDGVDNDSNGDTDCDDVNCRHEAACIETMCTDGVDNDGDSHTDCEDFDCLYTEPTCAENREITDATCSDNVDNDNNSYTDCRDFSCQKSPLVTVCEGNKITCSDGLDNDGNGFVDCNDLACRYCPTGQGTPRVVSVCPPCE